MAQPQNSRNGLTWNEDYWLPARVTPAWSTSPNVDAAKSIVARHIPGALQGDLDIAFVGEGALKKTYKIHDKKHDKLYAVRIPLPVDPGYKISAEVATMEPCANIQACQSPKSWLTALVPTIH